MVNSVKYLRDRAVEVALTEFRNSGDISMRKVADALDVSATALYHHFANKKALLDAVADRAFPAFEKRLRSTHATEPSQIIRHILDEYRKFAGDERNLFGLMFVGPRPVARKFPADFAAHRSAVFNLLWKAVNDSMIESGTTDSDESLHLAHDMWALAHGLILLWRAGRFSDDRTFYEIFGRSIDRLIDTL